MTGPLTATPRSSNLNVPATQGTAPVVKFRCLFTHDLRRKAKRWQDGFLRFHTFNKRVMVYDNTGYFIGDLHWRAPEGIQDGDELELDKGVLIQVCEPLERTDTDLSELYKNKSQTSPSLPGEVPSSARSTPRPSQQASRSLNDLLGIRKTPAPAPQSRSPYERRHASRPANSHQPVERPAKRQRVSPERVGRPSEQGVVDLSNSPPRKQQTHVTNTQPPIRPLNQRPTALPERQPPPAAPTPVVPPSASTSFSTSTSKQPQAPPSDPIAHPHPPDPKPLKPTAEPPRNTLRLSNDRPRRKLMYQESSRAPARESEGRSQLSRTHAQNQVTIKHEETSSPLIILDDSDDDTAIPPPSYQPRSATPESSPPPPIIKSSNGDTTEDIDILALFHSPPPPVVKSSNGDTAEDLDILALFQNLSEHESTQRPQPPPNPPNPPKPISLLRSGTSLPIAQHSAQAVGDAHRPRSGGLRKSYSEPTTINSLHTRPLPAPSPLNPVAANRNEDQETGPWTEEALDLFDFWPPGRPKPT
ncbi:uncharacterized protein BDV14DRAFT_197919 [Aspergillus stella-maris]|uniref:uncharacterized protein n=1 Tax=Aspergillus stella-maris TaxID=1810926 RepID=UPI003CCCFE8B